MSVKNGSFSHFSVSYPAASSRLCVKVRLSQSTSRSGTALCLWKMTWETIWTPGPWRLLSMEGINNNIICFLGPFSTQQTFPLQYSVLMHRIRSKQRKQTVTLPKAFPKENSLPITKFSRLCQFQGGFANFKTKTICHPQPPFNK